MLFEIYFLLKWNSIVYVYIFTIDSDYFIGELLPKVRGNRDIPHFVWNSKFVSKIRVRKLVKSNRACDIVLTFIHFAGWMKLQSYFCVVFTTIQESKIIGTKNTLERRISSSFVPRLKQLKIFSTRLNEMKIITRAQNMQVGNSKGRCVLFINTATRCLFAKECGKLCGYELVCIIPLDMKKSSFPREKSPTRRDKG